MKECTTCRTCFPDHINYCPLDGRQTLQSIAGEPILDGRYQLEMRLGQGGMGVVYKAHHVFLKTAHAIKVILPDLVGNYPTLQHYCGGGLWLDQRNNAFSRHGVYSGAVIA